jgi:hypothetical protein
MVASIKKQLVLNQIGIGARKKTTGTRPEPASAPTITCTDGGDIEVGMELGGQVDFFFLSQRGDAA